MNYFLKRNLSGYIILNYFLKRNLLIVINMAEEPIVPEEKDIWVVFDGYGNQIFNTYDEIYANFDFMQPINYNKQECTIIKNPIDDQGEIIKVQETMERLKILPNGKLQKIILQKGDNDNANHIPAPNNSRIILHGDNKVEPETRENHGNN